MYFRRRAYRGTQSMDDVPDIVKLWLLRILVRLGSYQSFLMEHAFSNEPLAELIGLGKWIDPTPQSFEVKAVLAELRKLHVAAERRWKAVTTPPCLSDNIKQLSVLVGLSDIDARVLEFVVLLNNERLLEEATEWLGQMSSAKAIHTVSVVLDLPEQDIRTALSPHGLLAQSGLLSVSRHGLTELRGKLDLLSDTFADHITAAEANPVELLRDTVSLSSPAVLAMADYDHVAPSLAVLAPYLRKSLGLGRKGVNIFVYGKPGTGKSQLAKLLAAQMSCELFEVASQDSSGDAVSGERRLRAFRAAQSFFAKRRAMILFDEVEDVFNDGDSLFGRKSTAQTRKAWINRTLEENPVPAIWLSNSVHCLDPAFVRRFDIVIELPVPSRKHRERIIHREFEGLLEQASVTRIAESEDLAPAVVTRAASVVRLIRDELGAQGVAAAVDKLLDNTLQAQGHRPLPRYDQTRLPDTYDPRYLNADVDLAAVADGLELSREGRLCLYGPPGTGKTAYGRWLADRLGVPLHARRASDLLSMWVGENERNIARAFREAEQDRAVLLIDEVDGFLQDRRGAQRGWEVTLVNEMLTQMESYPGVFIASTNLMGGLDQAALRRFDLKVRFDFLQPDAAWALFESHCAALSVSPPRAALRSALGKLRQLTPGDFAAVRRQHRLRQFIDADALLAALEAECAVKEGGRNAIGFI